MCKIIEDKYRKAKVKYKRCVKYDRNIATIVLPALLAILVFVALAPSVVGAATYTMHPTEPGADYTTIQAAIDAASDGDSIKVWNSTYYEHVEVQKQVNKYIFDSEWGSYGTGDGEFDGPGGTALGSNGKILVADKGNNRTQTIILNNVSNSFPMFSNATYANFTIGEDTIILILDANASFDGVCNLTDLMGTEISAAGSYAEFEYFPVTYQNVSYDEKWSVYPWFDYDRHQLNLLRGSGLITALNLELWETGTDVPKLVGVGGLTGDFHIETEAEGLKSTDTYLLSSIGGVGYADLYAQYTPDTAFENITFMPIFTECEKLQLTTNISGSSIWYYAEVLGLAHGAEPIYGVSPDYYSSLSLDVEYFPVTYQNVSYDERWSVYPWFDYDRHQLNLLRGSGLITALNLELWETGTDVPKLVGVGGLTGDFHIETEAEGLKSTDTYLLSSIGGVGYADLYAQYTPDTAFENITFMPIFTECEKLQLTTNTSGSSIWYYAEVLGLAHGAEPIYGVSPDYYSSLSLDVEYFPVTYQNVSYDEKWSVYPWFDYDRHQLNLLRGSGLITALNLELWETGTDVPKLVGVGGLTGDFHIETEAEGLNSTETYLLSSIGGVGYADLYAQYTPDTAFENITFMPIFTECEKLQLTTNTSGSSIWYYAEVLGLAHGAEPIYGVSPDYYSSLSLDVEYFPVTYQNVSYDEKWSVYPWFDYDRHQLNLLRGSGLITALNLELWETGTDVPKLVGVGGLTGDFHIETEAEGLNSTETYLLSSIGGVGYADLYAQYTPDTAFENITFMPIFTECEKLQLTTNTSGSSIWYYAEVLGLAHGAEPIYGVSPDYYSSLSLDVEYFPVTYQNVSYDEKWSVYPWFDYDRHQLNLLRGSGLITALNLELWETGTDVPKLVGVGGLTGDFHIETEAEGLNSTETYLLSLIAGVGYARLYAQYAPDTSFENITFMPIFTECEKLQLTTNTSGSSIWYDAEVLGYANEPEYLTFDHIPLDNVAITGIFDLTYHPVNIAGDEFDEHWSVRPYQCGGIYSELLVILRGTGTMTELNFIYDDSTAAHPEIGSYGFLRGDYNVSATILPHYMHVIANGTNVSAMDGSGQGGFGINFGFAPVLSIDKLDDPDPVLAGGTLNYTVIVTNIGSATATNVQVTEIYDANVTFVSADPAPSAGNCMWIIQTLNVSETKWINISVAVNSTTPNGTVLHNYVYVDYGGIRDADTEDTTVLAGHVSPEITSFEPPSPANDTICTRRTFNVTVNQTVNVSWYLNGALQQMNGSVQAASCTLHANVSGEHNVTAKASNPNGTDSQTWIWNVTEESPYTFVLSAGWNMISFPVEPLDKDADTIFGPDYYYLCTWDSDTGCYVPVDAVETEIGYWLLVLEDRSVTVLGTQLSEYNTDITQGWNMIGSLWTATNVPNGTETVPADQMYPYLYTWCGDHYELTQDIEPGLGYWALAYIDCELHVFPAPPAAPLQLPQVLLGDNDWRVRLALTSGAGTDVAEFGLHEDATYDFSAKFDVPEPPSPPPSSTSPYLQVYFYDPENPVVKKLSTCYIPHHFVDDDDEEAYNSWLFSVDYSGDASDVTIKWNAKDINAVPVEYSLLFIVDGEQIDMRTTPSYTFRAKTRTYEFEIRAITGGKKPDLVIEEEYEKGKAGSYLVFFVVKNIGTATAPGGHYAMLYVDGVEKDKKLVPTDLEPGETYKGSFKTKVGLTGKVENIKVCADSYNDVDELDEDNNCLKGRWQPVAEKPNMDKPPTGKPPKEKEAGLSD